LRPQSWPVSIQEAADLDTNALANGAELALVEVKGIVRHISADSISAQLSARLGPHHQRIGLNLPGTKGPQIILYI
jgi:hypothetical protein